MIENYALDGESGEGSPLSGLRGSGGSTCWLPVERSQPRNDQVML